MLLSQKEVNEKLQKLREQRAQINEMIDYYEHMKQQAISEHYKGVYTLDSEKSHKRPIVRY
ncbi:hypothetical protein GRF59_14505 [Paenibacillus sp. HJL G12]|uniref:Uncharacterized protein n=1 Tax=Paenibacillus dendrobii TaxID=2691084 RepID=A0A7X3IJ08_9BACL|nr:hypothetical protein [Paenibacillus dendrobii]MWV44829.1 hypothetical protein [Paenibacillus dendrobii]